MWAYALRRALFCVPVYLGILLLVMVALRVDDPVWGYLGKHASPEAYEVKRGAMGLDDPFAIQFARLVADVATLRFDGESWAQPGRTSGDIFAASLMPTLSITLPAFLLTSLLALAIALLSALYRGRVLDRALMLAAVVGMSVSGLAYVVLGQYWGAFRVNAALGREVFAVQGYEPGLANWPRYCLLPVLISTAVAVGHDARFYRAALVEELGRPYVATALAKGASWGRVLGAHVLRNAMVAVVTRMLTTLPFLVTGTLLLEVCFNIPGLGRALYESALARDFPVIQGLVAATALPFVASILATDLLVAWLDPRVRLP